MDVFIAVATKVIMAALILIAGWVGGNWVYKTVQAIKKLDGTLRSFLGGLAKYAIFALSVVAVLQQFGFQTASLLAVLGAAGLAIGLALQGTLSNVSAGVMLLILRPFNVGDTITSAGLTGTVKALGLFATEMSTPDNVYIFVPNSKLWNTDIQNFSRNDVRRQDIVVGISYADDIEKAFKTIDAVAGKDKRILSEGDKAPQVMVTGLGDSSVNITLRIWSKAPDFWSLKVDTTKAVKEALDKAGITIPFPTRTLEMTESAPAAKPAAKKKAA
ncbi:MAG: mechanosensitive ion channel [Alphaproteobacteria bacterium]|nr:mechanosensitive ion channel [Alphaproteobacteria bacterium]